MAIKKKRPLKRYKVIVETKIRLPFRKVYETYEKEVTIYSKSRISAAKETKAQVAGKVISVREA